MTDDKQGPDDLPVGRLTAYRPGKRMLALGLAVDHLMSKPVFSSFAFGPWSQALALHINTDCYFLVADERRRVFGMAAWSIVSKEAADAWLDHDRTPESADRRETGVVLMVVWSADNSNAHRLMWRAARQLFSGQQAMYFKRIYRNGRRRKGVIRPAAASPRDPSRPLD